jgi:WD40 repeat protein
LAASFAARSAIPALAVSRDGRCIAAAGPRVPLTVWRAPGGEAIASLPVGRGVVSLAFAGDGSRLAVGTLDGQVSVCRLRTADVEHELAPLNAPTEAIALSIDGATAAATGRDGSVWLRRLPASIKVSKTNNPPAPLSIQPLSATRVIFDWIRRVALL